LFGFASQPLTTSTRRMMGIMFICEPCTKAFDISSIGRSWGSCEICGALGQVCFDIPARQPPVTQDLEATAQRTIEHVFCLARERQSLIQAGDRQRLDALGGLVVQYLKTVPADAYPLIVSELVLRLYVVSHEASEARSKPR